AMTVLSALNLIVLMAQTGGLDSPFYSLWLLVIVASGIFGLLYTAVALGLTGAYFGLAAAQHSFRSDYLLAHLIQFVITLVAGGLAEWVYWRSRRARTQSLQLSSLSGQLSQQQVTAQTLLDHMADSVVLVDSELNIQLFNQAAQTLTGWDAGSAGGINY